ncbi:MAG TPA: glycosyltransferase [Pilimelia sp.]|nr:glycosyltransferase [Pilimelia sp.]
MRIVRLANFVMARSGGLRTALRCLGRGYLAAGHEPVLVVPGARPGDELTDHGRVITLPGLLLPGTGGYRVLPGRRRLARLLDELAPDLLEVSDRSTLRWIGRWARSRGVRSMMVSHESLTGLLDLWGVPAGAGVRVADALNARTAAEYDVVACTTAWAAEEFRRIGVPNLARVTLGVDLETFSPHRYDPALRARYAAPEEVLVVHCGRLSPEKRPEIAVDTIAALRAAGVPAVGVIAGDGPRRASLRRRAAGLPVSFTGFLPNRECVAVLLASADVALAPGPVETFGLAALEALACGTPVVVNARSALPEVLGDAGTAGIAEAAGIAGAAGVAATGTGDAFATGVRRLLSIPDGARRRAARARACRYGWPAAVESFLAAHGALDRLNPSRVGVSPRR